MQALSPVLVLLVLERCKQEGGGGVTQRASSSALKSLKLGISAKCGALRTEVIQKCLLVLHLLLFSLPAQSCLSEVIPLLLRLLQLSLSEVVLLLLRLLQLSLSEVVPLLLRLLQLSLSEVVLLLLRLLQLSLSEVVTLLLRLLQLSLHQMNRGLPALVFLAQVFGALLLLLLHLLLKLLDFCLPAQVVLILCLMCFSARSSENFSSCSLIWSFSCLTSISQLLCSSARSLENFSSFSLIWSFSCLTSVSQLLLFFARCSFSSSTCFSLASTCLSSVSQLRFFFARDLFSLLFQLEHQLLDFLLQGVVSSGLVVCLVHYILHALFSTLPALLFLSQVLGGPLLALKEFFLSSLQQVYGHQVLVQLLLLPSPPPERCIFPPERRIFPPERRIFPPERRIFPPEPYLSSRAVSFLQSAVSFLQSVVSFLTDCHTLKEFISSHHEQFYGLCVKLQETLIVLAVGCLLVALV
ncbi:hypothetical protein F7725_003996 [Dissostichus mawsoni]|uniref:Uncharacterized protein n=1 Tax=Dissostichus mawsoni TaxID=36200 RepID=A0A7J5YF44_DISMA|nr:hypothetical protein F7725_003996 [Dissostichus mawsoni]